MAYVCVSTLIVCVRKSLANKLFQKSPTSVVQESKWTDVIYKIISEFVFQLIPFSAFWLRSSIVSVLISLLCCMLEMKWRTMLESKDFSFQNDMNMISVFTLLQKLILLRSATNYILFKNIFLSCICSSNCLLDSYVHLTYI